MKGDAQPLIKFFDGSDKRFIIPLYQRNYDWKEENCEQLFQDLMKLHNSDRKSHFLVVSYQAFSREQKTDLSLMVSSESLQFRCCL